MKTVSFVLFLALLSNHSYSQLSVNPDSTRISFANGVTVALAKKASGGKFELDRVKLRTLIAQYNYLQSMLDASKQKIILLERESLVMDSSVQVLKLRTNLMEKRLLLHKNSYEDLKKIASTYDQQITTLTSDIKAVTKRSRSGKRRAFLKGLGGGLVGGILVSALLIAQAE